MKFLDKLAKYVSWATLLVLTVLVICRHCTDFCPPEWLQMTVLPILTAAAVGYLTNWIAICLLFKPYRKICGIQGVIPRNKAKLGHELGEIIPEYLLKPDELAEQLGTLVCNYLQNPDLLNDLRSKVNLFLKRFSGDIANFLLPYIESTLNKTIQETLTQEKLGAMYDAVVLEYLAQSDRRMAIANDIVGELKNRLPDITDAIQNSVRDSAKYYIQSEYPLLSNWVNADEFVGKMVDRLNWERIGSRIAEKLEKEDTRLCIANELVNLTMKLQAYLKSPEAADRVGAFLIENRAKAENYVKKYLSEQIPGLVDNWLHQDALWDAVEYQMLPLVQAFILHRLKHEKHDIIQRFNLPGKIEQSVREMDMAELHKMLLKASEDNLTVIQLLGYLLGAIAGMLSVLAQ